MTVWPLLSARFLFCFGWLNTFWEASTMNALMKKLSENEEFRMDIIIIIFCSAVAIAILIYGGRRYDNMLSEIYAIIDEPTFVGEVVDMEHTKSNRIFPLSGGIDRYFLHITGSYIVDGETIYVDRNFQVFKYLYEQYKIGDVIPHP